MARESLEERLVSAVADERLEAITAVHRESRTELLDTVRVRLDAEDDPRVLSALIGVVGKFGEHADIARLAAFLKHKSSRVRSSAVKAVMRRDSSAADLIKPALSDRAPRVRAQAIVALAKTPGADIMKSLLQMANSSTPQVALMAVWTATKLASPPIVPVLVKLARSTDADVRAEARGALKKLAATLPEAAIVVKAALARKAAKSRPTDPGSRPIAAGPGADTELSLSGARVPRANEEPSLPSARHAVVRPADSNELSLSSAREPRGEGPPSVDNSTLGIGPETSVLMPVSVSRPVPQDGEGPDGAPRESGPVAPPSRVGSGRTTSPDRAGPSTGERPSTGRVPRPTGGTRVPSPGQARALSPQVLGGLAGVALLAVLAVIGLSGGEPPPPPPPPTREPVVHAIATPAPTTVPTVKPDEPRFVFAAPAFPPPGALTPPEPTLEEVEAHMKFSLRPKGITAPTVIRLMAYERVQAVYRIDIARAKELADERSYDLAISILDASLEKLAPDHHVGRVAVLRALILIAKDARKFDRVATYRTQLAADQARVTEICVEAARSGGMPQADVQATLDRLKQFEKTSEQSTRGADWLSGAKLFEGEEAHEEK